MESFFPAIKSTSTLPSSNFLLKLQKEINEDKPIIKYNFSKPLLQQNRIFSQNHQGKPFQNSSRLPPIILSHEAPSFSPLIIDPLTKLQSSRRTVSNSVLPLELKNAVLKYGCKTRTGTINGIPKGNNQDAYIIQPSLQGIKGYYLFAVCDGHGTEGHHVSRLIKTNIISNVERELCRRSPIDAIKSAIEETSKRVLTSKIDTAFSGSTLVCVLILGDNVICANVGDSRAVIGNNMGS